MYLTNKQKLDFIRDVESFLREIKLTNILEDSSITIVKYKRTPFNFFWKGWKKIETLFKLNGVITGSTALSMYRYKGEKIFNRKSKDWDFILSKDNLKKFCGIENIYDVEMKGSNLRLGLKTGIVFYSVYGDTTIFNHDIDCISLEDFNRYTTHKGIKVADLDYIIEQKLYLFKEGKNEEKHFKDIFQIMSKFKSLE
jgi:hypothetical protein